MGSLFATTTKQVPLDNAVDLSPKQVGDLSHFLTFDRSQKNPHPDHFLLGYPALSHATTWIQEQHFQLETSFFILMFADDISEKTQTAVGVAAKQRAFLEAGIDVEILCFPMQTNANDFQEAIESFNEDKSIGGVIVMNPIPLSCKNILKHLTPDKDVDGILPGKTCSVAEAAVNLMRRYWTGDQRVLVIGSKGFVGSSVVRLLKNLKIDHIGIDIDTDCFENLVRSHKYIISCVGKAGVIRGEFLEGVELIVDVGRDYDENGLSGDVDRSAYGHPEKVKRITPVSGGLGPYSMITLLDRFLGDEVDLSRFIE